MKLPGRLLGIVSAMALPQNSCEYHPAHFYLAVVRFFGLFFVWAMKAALREIVYRNAFLVARGF